MFGRKKARALPELPPLDVIDIRVYAVNSDTGYAYIGTESGPGSEELVFRATGDLAQRAHPWISEGILYGLMLDKSLILSA
jgi:hypothetical protein